MDEYIGIIKLFAGSFAPQGWAFCDGSILPISSNQALFAIVGTIYGGNGSTTFALPDLRSRVALGAGPGPGLANHPAGQAAGTEQVVLTTANMPAHTHSFMQAVSTAPGTSNSPAGGFPALVNATTGGGEEVSVQAYSNTANATNPGQPNTIGITGSNLPVSIMQPYLSLNYIICMQGIFPSRG